MRFCPGGHDTAGPEKIQLLTPVILPGMPLSNKPRLPPVGGRATAETLISRPMTRPRFRPAAVLLALLTSVTGAAAQVPATFDTVRALARERAAKPWVERPGNLDPFWTNLKYADHGKINFRRGRSVWNGDNRGFHLEFFHPGWVFPKTVAFHEVAPDATRLLEWNADFFDYRDLVIPDGTPKPDGFAGFRILAPLNTPGELDELAVFLGSSYFRSLAPGLGFGTSARGLALNPMRPQGEEFPDFVEWWIERPEPGAREIRAWALLDSPSVAGAYQFRIQPGRGTVMEIETELTFRQDVELIGIAPFSSMMWYSEFTQPKPLDFRPEIHDSDGLLIHFGELEAAWRPLDTGKSVRHSVFAADKFFGFGLAQRDRDFRNYQDLEANFQQRPSVWVEPVGVWPEGRINLIETPGNGDGSDNVVCFWEPKQRPKAGEPIRLAYRIQWLPEISVAGLSKVMESRRSHQSFPAAAGRPDEELYVIDFSTPANPVDDETRPELLVEVDTNTKLLDKTLQRNPNTGGWRATFTVQIDEKVPAAELACRLLKGGRSISERWTVQWKR
jgi:glucans biosynthesis protein